MATEEDLRELIDEFEAVSLPEMDERAALLRRVDNKYAVPEPELARLARRLQEGHQVLEIEGRRRFGYSSTYFETPDLRCFVDHVEDRKPRFKMRTRLYEDTSHCVFEVKLKREDGETDKRQLHYDSDDRARLTGEARECVRTALGDAGLDAPDELDASLTTSFARVTFAARSGAERLTCDFDVRLAAPDGTSATLREGLVLVETKSETGESPADRELAEMGFEPISLSKYRVGMSTVGAARRFGMQPGGELFG